jgi:hypothetical protein
MADINIQRKSSASAVVWWIVAIVAAMLLIWLVFGWWGTPDYTGELRGPSSPIVAV